MIVLHEETTAEAVVLVLGCVGRAQGPPHGVATCYLGDGTGAVASLAPHRHASTESLSLIFGVAGPIGVVTRETRNHDLVARMHAYRMRKSIAARERSPLRPTPKRY